MPILRSEHSKASTPPVASAIFGMSPSTWVLGNLEKTSEGGLKFDTGVLTQEVTEGTVSCRRQRPACSTSGKLVPAGTLVNVNVPFAALVVITRGDPVTSDASVSSAGPSTNACTVPLGTYTSTLGIGSTPLGPYVVPLIEVVAPPKHET